jgi:hypothetical protein
MQWRTAWECSDREQLSLAAIKADRTLIQLAEQFDVTYFTISPTVCRWPNGTNV